MGRRVHCASHAPRITYQHSHRIQCSVAAATTTEQEKVQCRFDDRAGFYTISNETLQATKSSARLPSAYETLH